MLLSFRLLDLSQWELVPLALVAEDRVNEGSVRKFSDFRQPLAIPVYLAGAASFAAGPRSIDPGAAG